MDFSLYFNAAGVKCFVAAVKRLPVPHHNRKLYFYFPWDQGLVLGRMGSMQTTLLHMEGLKGRNSLYNFEPLKPNFYILKLWLTGVYTIFFLFLLKNIDCGYSLKPPRRGGSNEYPQSMFRADI